KDVFTGQPHFMRKLESLLMGRAGQPWGRRSSLACLGCFFPTRPESFCHRGTGVVEPIESLASSRSSTSERGRFGGSRPPLTRMILQVGIVCKSVTTSQPTAARKDTPG